MRLTLRTMLCYLDDVLEPADAADLGKKIEDSEYASQVVHRIRTSMRRLRLGSPQLSGEGAGFDANTVADYLDNTLPPEKVADFERICLDPDSEVQLAEVGACHQILTLVLGEPAEVPPAMRQRIYDLGQPEAIAARGQQPVEEHPITNGAAKAADAAADAPAASSAAASASPTVSAASAAATTPPEPKHADEGEVARRERHKPEVPEYLKQGSKRSWWPIVVALLLISATIGIVAYAMRQGDQRPVAVLPPATTDDALLTDSPDDESPPDDDAPEAHDETATGSTDTEEIATTDGSATPVAPSDTTDDEGAGGDGDDLHVDAPGSETGTESGKTPSEPTDDTSVAKVDPPPAEGTAPPATVEKPSLPLVDKVIGHYISTGHALAILDTKAETWNRLASPAGVKPGMHLRALPTFRPQVLLDNAIQITFSGDSEVVVGNPLEDGTPFLNMPFGRVMLATVSKAGSAVVVRAGDREALLTMVNADAAVALEVAPFHIAGADPTTEPAHIRVTLTVTNGQVQWQEVEREAVTLDAGQQLRFLDDEVAGVAATEAAPKWIKSSDISDIDRRASATLEPLLGEDGPIEIKLEELSEDPRVEVRSLAMRSLASLDRFNRVLETLKDETLKSYWSQHIDQLQAALAHSPAVAAEIRAAAVRSNGTEGERLYRMLWGYSPEQLKEGSAKQLVDSLKHSSMDVRVVASNTLRHITGRTQGYHPHLPEARRRTAERQWEQSLAAGEVVYATPFVSLPSRKPREMP